MSRKKMMVEDWSSTALVAATSSVNSGWLDIGKRTPDVEITSSSTGGTPALEVDWSRNGGSTTMTTDPVTQGTNVVLTGKARWLRVRVKNDHAVSAFSAHSTVVKRDRSVGY